MWSRVMFVAACVVSAQAGSDYSVPVPAIEAFSPKGLRLSIPDSQNIRSVQFYLNFMHPVVDNEPGTVAKEVDDKQGSYWIYYNPGVLLNLGDTVHYKLIVNKDGQYWSRFGSYPIVKVLSLADNSIVAVADDCDDQGQQHVVAFPSSAELEEPGLTASSSNSKVKSAYSMYKSMESKPITRSSTTTTSGTYYVKPSGVVEASGFKSASSFDSTRRDGEQWQHSKSELSASEIEDLKRIHGQDFMSLPAFAGLHSGGAASSSYRQSYSSSSQTRPSYGSSSSYHQTGQTADVLPLLRVPSGASGYSSYSKYEQHGRSGAPAILSPGAAAYSAGETSYLHSPVISTNTQQQPDSYFSGKQTLDIDDDSQQHIPVSGNLDSIAQPSYSSVQTKYHRKETVTSSSSPAVSTFPSGGASSSKTETLELQEPSRTVLIPVPLRGPSAVTYNGEIFRSTIRPSTPNSCAAVNTGYKSPTQVDVVTLERTVQEMQCLSVLMENTVKAEVYVLKEANTELKNRIEELEKEFQRFRRNCQYCN